MREERWGLIPDPLPRGKSRSCVESSPGQLSCGSKEARGELPSALQ